MPDDDEALVERIRAGDASGFRALFDTYAGALCHYAAGYLHAREPAEEVVQEVFFRLWALRHEWPITGSVRAYLYSATRNRALNILRHTATEARWEEELSRHADQAASDAHADITDDALRREGALARAIRALPEGQRAAVQLRWFSGLSYIEVAAALGVTRKTVENQLGRALKSLRVALAGYAGRSPSD